MKRYVWLTALALTAALGLLAVSALWLDGTAVPVSVEPLYARGRKDAAAGLTLGTSYTYGGYLRWDTVYDIEAGREDTAFSFDVRGSQNRGATTVYDDWNKWQVGIMAYDESNSADPITAYLLREAVSQPDASATVYLKAYHDTYPLYLSRYGGTQPLFTTGWGDMVPFPALHIPVTEEDFFIANIHPYASGGAQGVVCDTYVEYAHLANRFYTFSLPREAGVLTTVGFAADTRPQADWAPEGYGLWYIPAQILPYFVDEEQLQSAHDQQVNQAQLVYPLDIETQRIVQLGENPSRGEILLVTAEDGQFVLRVLASDTYALRQTLTLGPAQTREESVTTYLSGGEEITRDTVDYAGVYLHPEAAFTAIAVGERLTVLRPEGGGYAVDFACDMVSLLLADSDDGPSDFVWSDLYEQRPGARVYSAESPTGDESGFFARLPMAYRPGKLAIAWYDSLYGNTSALVQIYGPEGLMLGEKLMCQLGAQTYSRFFGMTSAQPTPWLDWAA